MAKISTVGCAELLRLLAITADAMFVIDLHGCIVLANGAAEELFAASCLDLVGTSVERRLPLLTGALKCQRPLGAALSQGVELIGFVAPQIGVRLSGDPFAAELRVHSWTNGSDSVLLVGIRSMA